MDGDANLDQVSRKLGDEVGFEEVEKRFYCLLMRSQIQTWNQSASLRFCCTCYSALNAFHFLYRLAFFRGFCPWRWTLNLKRR